MLGTQLLGTQLLQGPTGFVSYTQPELYVDLEQGVQTEQADTGADLQQRVQTEQAVLLLDLEQQVRVDQPDTGVDLQQSVIAYNAPGVDIQQSVKANQAAATVDLQQMVLVATVNQRADWTLVITVDGSPMPEIWGDRDIRIYAEEGRPRTAEWAFINPDGQVYLHTWAGKPVTIDHISAEDESGQVALTRLFTGVISKPEYTHDLRATLFTATDRRKERIGAKSREYLANQIGGHWSPHVFNEDASSYEYAQDRLKTVAASMGYDAKGQLRVTSYRPKVTPDFVLTDEQVFYERISFRFATREDVVNRSQIELKYRYSILRHRERGYYWQFPYTASGWREQMINPVDLTPREIISGAIDATGWDLASITWGELPPAAVYYVNGIPYVWSPKKAASVTYIYERDGNGDIVYDEDGQAKVKEVQVNSYTDPTGLYCISASWKMATRFAQTATETYSVTVEAPQSVDQYGLVEGGSSGYGCESEYDDAAWEDLEGYISPSYDHRNVLISDGSRGGAWYDPPLVESANGDWIWITDENRAEFEEAARCSIAAARVSLLEAHRRNYVDLVLEDQFAGIDLHHTVELDTSVVEGTGRVYSVEYTFNHMARSETIGLRLAFSQVFSSATAIDSAIVAPTAPSNADQPYDPDTIFLQNHIGNQRYSPEYNEEWTGLMTNYRYRDTSGDVEVYPHGFIVPTEAADSMDRDERELAASQTYTVEIPHDPLTIYKVA